MASATEQDRVRELQRALYRAAKANPKRGQPNAGGEERRRAVCGRTACTDRGGGGRKPAPVGNAARRWRLPPTLHLAGEPPRRIRRLHAEPDGRLGRPAGAQPADDARGSPATAPLPDPRSRRQVQRRLRSRLPKRRNQCDPHTRPGTERERTRRALGRQRPSRVPRPPAHLQRAATRARASRLCPPLQPASAASGTRTPPTRASRRKPDTAASASLSAAKSQGPARRADPRVRAGSLTGDQSPYASTAPFRSTALFDTPLLVSRARAGTRSVGRTSNVADWP